MTETAGIYQNQPSPSKKSKMPLIIAIIIVIIIGGIFIFRQPKKTNKIKVTPTSENQPSPTEKLKIDKKSVKIQVLNGTGTPGQAGSVVSILKDAEYTSDNIKTGNAEEYSTTDTIISAKEGFEDAASDIKDLLEGAFSKIEINSTPLAEDNEYDIVITTGGKKYEESDTSTTPEPTDSETSPTETPTPTLTPSPTQTPTPTSTP